MEKTRITQALRGHQTVGLDSCVLIYFLEDHDQFGIQATEALRWACASDRRIVLSALALLEVQVGPYRKGMEEVADSWYALLGDIPGIQWIDLTYALADHAAELRGKYRLSTPDSIHLATAIHSGATLFVTNDRELPDMEEIGTFILED